jgi:predicted RNase H-like nuclease
VTERRDVVHELLLELETGMVGAEVDTHSASIADVRVRGVDGCRGGWLSVDVPGFSWRLWSLDETGALLHDDTIDVVAIDVPIGLPDGAGSRACDREARKLLGRRGISVFPAPCRAVLTAASYAGARDILAARGGPSMSAQAFGIVRAVAAVDGCLSAAADDRVVECHPEVAFCLLGGGSGLPGKKTHDGATTRRQLLTAVWPDLDAVLAVRPPRTPLDDALDALACAWTATRFARGEHMTFGDGARDTRGLPMRIVA